MSSIVKEASISEKEATKEKLSYFLNHMLKLVLFKQYLSKDFYEFERNLYFVKPKNISPRLWNELKGILEETRRTRFYLFIKN